MRLTKTLIAAAAVVSFGTTSAIAGGFADEIVEAPVVIVEPTATTRSTYGVILPILALAALVALASSSDSDTDS